MSDEQKSPIAQIGSIHSPTLVWENEGLVKIGTPHIFFEMSRDDAKIVARALWERYGDDIIGTRNIHDRPVTGTKVAVDAGDLTRRGIQALRDEERRAGACFSRSVCLTDDEERKEVISKAHIVDCECGITFLLRVGSVSECPSCESEHMFDEESQKAVRTCESITKEAP